jgi:glycosyltransferase involved in cell wall biosynthesis
MSISKNEFLNSIKREFDTKIVDKRFSFFGCVSPNEVYEKYIESDALINISDLESFSNNYMEAWKTNTPLIVSDRDFARNICGDSALYVDPYNPKDVVMAILKLRKNYDLRKKMTDCGKEKLQELPSLYTRNSIIMEKIKKIM